MARNDQEPYIWTSVYGQGVNSKSVRLGCKLYDFTTRV